MALVFNFHLSPNPLHPCAAERLSAWTARYDALLRETRRQPAAHAFALDALASMLEAGPALLDARVLGPLADMAQEALDSEFIADKPVRSPAAGCMRLQACLH